MPSAGCKPQLPLPEHIVPCLNSCQMLLQAPRLKTGSEAGSKWKSTAEQVAAFEKKPRSSPRLAAAAAASQQLTSPQVGLHQLCLCACSNHVAASHAAWQLQRCLQELLPAGLQLAEGLDRGLC